MRKVQLYLSEEHYRLLKQLAAERGSMAQVVRDLLDEAGRPRELEDDPFLRHVLAEKTPSGEPYDAETAKRDLYREPS